jgi:hypothetical protein
MSIYGNQVPVISKDTEELRLSLARAANACPMDLCNPVVRDVVVAGSYRLCVSRVGDACFAAEFYSQGTVGNAVIFKFGDLLQQLKLGRYYASLFQGTDFLSEFELELARAGDLVIDATTIVGGAP